MRSGTKKNTRRRPERHPVGPLYNKIKLTILSRISQGKYQPDDRIPSELEFVEEFGVSRMTVNRALRELTQEGILVRVPGVGTFVAKRQPQSPIVELSDIAEEIRDRGHDYGCRIVTLESEPGSSGVARALEIDGGEQVFHSVLVHLENEVPVALEDRYVKPSFAPDYLDQDFSRVSPYEYLMACGPVSEIEHTLNATLPNSQVARQLAISRDEPCLLLVRRTWSGAEVVTFTHFYYPGSRYRLASRYRLSKYRSLSGGQG